MTNTESTQNTNEDNGWMSRLEELLRVKNLDDLKSELSKLAAEIQTEIQSFDFNAHLSPEAKTRLKNLEQKYSQVMRTVQKAQKQFDREFNKSIRVLKRTRQDAEKHIKNIKTKISKHRISIVKASGNLRKKINKKPTAPKTVKKTKVSSAKRAKVSSTKKLSKK